MDAQIAHVILRRKKNRLDNLLCLWQVISPRSELCVEAAYKQREWEERNQSWPPPVAAAAAIMDVCWLRC